ncbi:MAG: ATP-binding protein [Eggerthellaceae bacterium]|nr:ATP-binding protein [Eggerthellaceae bacterium]
MYERKAYGRLLDWKRSSNGETALLVEGARRVGKTTLVKLFAEREYAASLLIDFAHTSDDVRDTFRLYATDLDRFFQRLQTLASTRLVEGDSLVVFDEVQRFPLAREFLKYLVEDGRYHYVETGSLVSIKRNVEGIVIPSEEEALELDPLDFEEWLWAMGERALADAIREAYGRLAPLDDAVHRMAMRLFREYLLVGGMPQVVGAYEPRKEFGDADRSKRRILRLYGEDVGKFAGNDRSRVEAMFQGIPGQLSKHEKKFTLASIDKNARYREYAGALRWLESSRTVNVCRSATDPNAGLALSADDQSFKVYMADTGLLCAHAFADRRSTPNELYKAVLFDKIGVNEGMLVENCIAQQLKASGRRLFFYSKYSTDARDRMEIDFLAVREYADAGLKPRVSPIEVKSSGRYSTKSLEKFRAKFGKHVGTELVLHPKNVQVQGNRVYLPLYMAHLV